MAKLVSTDDRVKTESSFPVDVDEVLSLSMSFFLFLLPAFARACVVLRLKLGAVLRSLVVLSCFWGFGVTGFGATVVLLFLGVVLGFVLGFLGVVLGFVVLGFVVLGFVVLGFVGLGFVGLGFVLGFVLAGVLAGVVLLPFFFSLRRVCGPTQGHGFCGHHVTLQIIGTFCTEVKFVVNWRQTHHI